MVLQGRRPSGFIGTPQSKAVCPGLHDVARMENSTKAITAKLKTIIAIAPTSILESGAMRHFLVAVERQR
jgi:hypothetical protein